MAQGPAIMASEPPPICTGLTAGRSRADVDDRVRRVQLAAGELERLQDRQHLLDAGDGRQRLGLELVLVADDADDGALLARLRCGLNPSSRMRSRTWSICSVGGIGTENDNHRSITSICTLVRA